MLESKACDFVKKEGPTQVFSFKYYEILSNICERLFLYFRILKTFEKFLKNEKMANRKLGKIGKVGNLGKIIPSFLMSEFSILPYSQNLKLRLKNLGKKFPRFPSFLPGPFF